MTALAGEAATRMVAPGTTIETATARFGASVIESEAAYAIAGHAALDAFASYRGVADAVIPVCFGDPGLMALKEACDVPVVGMAVASIVKACATGARFSIVTGGAGWKPMLEAFVAARGFAARLASVRTIAATGDAILRDPAAALEPIAGACRDCARGRRRCRDPRRYRADGLRRAVGHGRAGAAAGWAGVCRPVGRDAGRHRADARSRDGACRNDRPVACAVLAAIVGFGQRRALNGGRDAGQDDR